MKTDARNGKGKVVRHVVDGLTCRHAAREIS